MKIKGEKRVEAGLSLCETREFREFREFRDNEICLVKLELEFTDFQGLDASLKSGWWNSKLRCRA